MGDGLNERARSAYDRSNWFNLRDAVDAALDLHRIDRGGGPDPDNRCFECAEAAPCPTVRAIASALVVTM